MRKAVKKFKKQVKNSALNPEVEKRFRKVAERFGQSRGEWAPGEFDDYRERLSRIKQEMLENQEKYLDQVEAEVTALGGKVYRAGDAAQARAIILDIAGKNDVRVVVKGKSMTSEEIGLTPALEKSGCEVFETDLGEYIIQLAGEPPSHIIVPAVHKSKAEIADLFAAKLGMKRTEIPEELTRQARDLLREKFLKADMGITGAKAIVAENGTIVLVENEGNIRLTTTLPRIHVALVGFEKIIPKLADLAVHLRLLPRAASGQKISGYVSWIRGPKKSDERDGPQELHLVLLDNGRGGMRKDPILQNVLKCIRCGSCLNACPVYQHIGGHAYGSVYSGPIGAMITLSLLKPDHGWMLPFLSTLCGACTDVCPAKIPIHHILLDLRRRAIEGAKANEIEVLAGNKPQKSFFEEAAFGLWSAAATRPAAYRFAVSSADYLMRFVAGNSCYLSHLPPPANAWTQGRDVLIPENGPFHCHQPDWDNLEKTKEIQASAPDLQPVKTPIASEAESIDKIDLVQLFMKNVEEHKGETYLAADLFATKAILLKILQDFSGKTMVRWNHPELDEIGIDSLAGECGIFPAAVSCELNTFNNQLFIDETAKASLGITAVDFGIAEVGAVALFTGAGRERSISLLPPVHIAIVKAEKIVFGLQDFITALTNINKEYRGVTFVSGPSMTGDIEFNLVSGVHGPGRFIVIVRSQ
jgi:L-lactate dehydrogenase complex protein LldF